MNEIFRKYFYCIGWTIFTAEYFRDNFSSSVLLFWILPSFQNEYGHFTTKMKLFTYYILEEEIVSFKMEITGLFKDALTRQANEAVRIKNCKKSEILNSKSQFNHPPITRIIMDRKKNFKANSTQKNQE